VVAFNRRVCGKQVQNRRVVRLARVCTRIGDLLVFKNEFQRVLVESFPSVLYPSRHLPLKRSNITTPLVWVCVRPVGCTFVLGLVTCYAQ
jgi:hypothetical protein